jgi:hypothetical protein
MKSNTLTGFVCDMFLGADSDIVSGLPDRAENCLGGKPLLRSYRDCVMVELLPLDLSEALVRPDKTDNNDGLKFGSGSDRLGITVVRRLAG